MNSYVLFSPLGLSDPTRGNRDSAFLHILRYYKPTVAYLFMTKRICELDEKLDLYNKMAQRLCKKDDFDCRIEKFKHPEIDNPQIFDIFYDLFEGYLNSIATKNPNSTILINVSSSTPAMKEACKTLATVSTLKIFPVQVSSPEKSENRTSIVDDNYDVEREWNDLYENIEDLNCPNRCRPVELNKSLLIYAREILKSQINNYNYSAAFDLSQRMEDFISPISLSFIKAAHYRLCFRLNESKIIAGAAFLPIQNNPEMSHYEYILNLKIKLFKNEYADFIRAVSPIITNLFLVIANSINRGFFEKKLCSSDNKGIIRIIKEKLNREDYLNYYNEYFKEKYKKLREFEDTKAVSSSNILPYIVKEIKNEKIKGICVILRSVEEYVRNSAAHEITTVTDESIKDKSGYSTSQIQAYLESLFEYAFPNYKRPQMWKSYDAMNKKILDSL